MTPVEFLLVGLSGASFLIGLYLGSWYLRRAVRELQYGLAALEDRLVREVKRRAVRDRWDREGDQDLEPAAAVEEMKRTLPPGFLSPVDFVKKKWGGRHGSQPQ